MSLLSFARSISEIKPEMKADVVLLVAGESQLVDELQQELKTSGYPVAIAHNTIDSLLMVHRISPSLIILDVMLNGLSSLDACQRLRSMGSKIPVIMLTPEDEVRDRVAALNAGADDCLSKPFFVEELLARVRAHLRRDYRKDEDVLRFEDLTLNRKTREVSRNGELIDLTAKEFDLLDYLMINRRQVVTREQILEHVWGYDFMGDSNVIEVYIRYLRLKLESGNQKRLIYTVRCVGYVLRDAP